MMETPRFAEILVQGSDAASFLHAQLTCDVKSLASGQCQFGGICGADGRVQCLLLLARTGESDFRLLLPADLAQALLERLLRYRLRARCTLTLKPAQIAADAADLPHDPATLRWTHAGFAWLVHTLAEDTLAPPLPATLWDEQVALGIPWLLPDTSERFLPQALGFERLHAFSLRKGCYPGQEVIARTHFLGRNKRRLARLRAPAGSTPVPPGSELVLAETDTPAGTLIVTDSAGCGLGVLMESAAAGMSVRAADASRIATFVIEGDGSETFGDISLNGHCDTPFSA